MKKQLSKPTERKGATQPINLAPVVSSSEKWELDGSKPSKSSEPE